MTTPKLLRQGITYFLILKEPFVLILGYYKLLSFPPQFYCLVRKKERNNHFIAYDFITITP